MSTQGGLNIVTDGLIFSVDAANNLGDNVTNVKNIVTPTETGTFVNGASVAGGAYDFDGVDDYIDFSSLVGGTGDFIATDSFTFSTWINIPSSQISVIFGRNNNANGNYALRLINGQVQILAQDTSANTAIFLNPTAITYNSWQYVTATYNGTTKTVSLYENTSFIGSNQNLSLSGNLYNSTQIAFGRRVTPQNDLYFDGQISNFKIYNKELTAAEISQNYEALKHRFE